MVGFVADRGAPKNKDTRGRRPPKSAPDAPRSGGMAQNEGGKEIMKGEREGGAEGPYLLFYGHLLQEIVERQFYR